MRCAIVGAGVSGLPTARWAKEHDVEPVVFEATDQVGGLWNYKADETEFATVMRSTVINTSKEMNAYSDFPPSSNIPTFMHNKHLLQYIKDYADHHGLQKYIRFNHKVLNIERAHNYDTEGKWVVTYENSQKEVSVETFDCVCICVGHHAIPNMPKPWPGQESFTGKVIHSHSYKTHNGYEGKTVVVVGIGNSAIDVAVELSRIADQVYLSTRRGAWIVPKVYRQGYPYDMSKNTRYFNCLVHNLPRSAVSAMFKREITERFDHAVYGLEPQHDVMAGHFSISDELHVRIATGTITVRPDIERFTETGVVFTDGSEVSDVDAVILCTGYTFNTDLVEHGQLYKVEKNRADFYKFMFPLETADRNTLAFIGYFQPLGSIAPCSEMQSRLFFAKQQGLIQLPSVDEMRAEVNKRNAEMRKAYYESPRHTIQVHVLPFLDELSAMLGSKPNLMYYFLTDHKLWRELVFGANVPYAYRLQGPRAWEGARDAVLKARERTFQGLCWRPADDPSHANLAKDAKDKGDKGNKKVV